MTGGPSIIVDNGQPHMLARIIVEQNPAGADVVTGSCAGCNRTVRTIHGRPIGERPVDSVWLDAEDSLAAAHDQVPR